MPSRDFTSEDLFSSRMMSMHNSTHSSQMKTVGPAISLRTSCWLLPQNEQKSVFLEPPPPTLLILAFRQSRTPGRANHLSEILRLVSPDRAIFQAARQDSAGQNLAATHRARCMRAFRGLAR